MRRRKRLRRNNEVVPPPPPPFSDVMPPVPEYASEEDDVLDMTTMIVKDEDKEVDLYSVPETVVLEDQEQGL